MENKDILSVAQYGGQKGCPGSSGFAITTWVTTEPSVPIFSFIHLHTVSAQHTVILC